MSQYFGFFNVCHTIPQEFLTNQMTFIVNISSIFEKHHLNSKKTYLIMSVE